jgi:hypothetical protein
MYMYSHGGIDLLPNAKLDSKALKTVMKIVSYIDEDAGKNMKFGMPQSYAVYKPWLIDEVARGEKGPRVMGIPGTHNARYYFDHPDEAVRVLEKASVLSTTIGYVTQYIEWLDTVLDYAGKAVDVYEAVQSGDYSAETGIEWLEEQGNKQKEKLQSKVEEAPLKLQTYGDKKVAEFKQTPDRLKQQVTTTVANPFRSIGLGSLEHIGVVDIASATMGEWMPAEIGLAARQKWNTLALIWLDERTPGEWEKVGEKKFVPQQQTPDTWLEEAKRRLLGAPKFDVEAWKAMNAGKYKTPNPKAWDSGPREWREEATDYKAWGKMFAKDKKLAKYIETKRNQASWAAARAGGTERKSATRASGDNKGYGFAKLKATVEHHIIKLKEGSKVVPFKPPRSSAVVDRDRDYGGGTAAAKDKRPGPAKKKSSVLPWLLVAGAAVAAVVYVRRKRGARKK